MASTSTSPTSSKLVLAWTLVFLSLTLPTTPLKIPKLGVVPRTSSSSDDAESLAADGFETLYCTQTLDHFSYRPESYTTFQQRYVVNSRYWGGPNVSSPIFVYTGDESGLFNDIYAAGFLTDNAPRYKSLLVYIEHRYYGESTPFGSMDEAFRNASTLGYFSSAQALADYAELIIDLKKNLSAENCPVIAYGGSYGGMLASWFRLKYPHIAIGAVASSAPILYFDDITPENGYFSVVTKDYRETSESCYNTIRQSWFEIDTIASQSNGLTLLSQKFNTCSPLNDTEELKDYLGIMFVAAAQYDYPPKYPVNEICNAIDGAPQGTDILGRMFAAVVAREGRQPCYYVTESDNTGGTIGPWTYQRCTEMVMPIGCGSNDTMFQAQPFDLKNYTDECRNMSGVTPRPHWITTEFGGHLLGRQISQGMIWVSSPTHLSCLGGSIFQDTFMARMEQRKPNCSRISQNGDIKSVLQRFSSNIIFSNGLRDPYSVGGVLQNISDSTVAIYTTQGAHCMDIYSTRPDDPEWIIWQRNKEINIIDGWIARYYADLAARTTNQA